MKYIIDIPEIPKNDKQRWVVANGTPYEARPHGEWIPCSERLPEEYNSYLVTKLDTYPNGSTFTTLAYFYTEETGWDIDGVIAWMPFPKPYKKEGDEK